MNHDNGYKALFSHPAMVADLIRGFVHEDWVRDLDFSTLEKVDGNFVTPGLRGRHSDVIWRVRWGGDRWLYVYLLIEFQSTVDPYMALRVMVYVGLLYQHLIQQGQVPESGKLPPVLPVILYNGIPPWGAARDIADLIEAVPGGLEHYRPQLRYCLLDEGRIVEAELEPLRNLAAALFRLEKSRGPEEIERVLAALVDWLRAPELKELRRSFTTWLRQVLLPARVPGAQIPQMGDLEEVRSMLAERVKEWTQEWKQDGLEAGRREGLKEGLKEGRKEGRKEGLKEGRREERREILEKGRSVLIQALEKRFGPLPDMSQKKVESLDSIETIMELSISSATAPSLAALGLD